MSAIPRGLRTKVDALLALIVPLHKVAGDRSLSTNSLSIRLYKGALIQLLDPGPSGLSVAEFEGCAWRAVFAAIRARATSHSVLDEEISKEVAAFKSKRRSKFRVCSRCHFSVPQDYRLEIKLWGASIIVEQAPPSGLATSQPSLRDGRIALAEPEFGAYLTMTAYERSKEGALDRFSRDISFLLGLLNFTLNHGNLTWSLGNTERDVRLKLFPGREIFLIDNDGLADLDTWRYYTAYPKSGRALMAKEIAKISQHVKVVDRLNKIGKKDRNFYRSFFELYFEALTEIDSDIVVMRLWKAAEHITMAQSADVIAKRLALTWDDKEAVAAVCYALGQRRNMIMHSCKTPLQIENLPNLFQHFLENAAWRSLSTDVRGVDHWEAIMKMSDINIDLDLAADAVKILKALR